MNIIGGLHKLNKWMFEFFFFFLVIDYMSICKFYIVNFEVFIKFLVQYSCMDWNWPSTQQMWVMAQ